MKEERVSDKARVADLMMRYRDVRYELRMAQNELVHELLTFQGTVLDAVMAGLVRPTFPLPSGLWAQLKKEERE
jgi:hypothetical protein